MSDYRSGAGDQHRLDCLGADCPGPPLPRQPTSRVGGIVAAATGLADAERPRRVTHRPSAQASAVAPIELYTYVPGRASCWI